jgi:hypothetical protein
MRLGEDHVVAGQNQRLLVALRGRHCGDRPCVDYFVDPHVKACVINCGRRPKVPSRDAVKARPMTRFDAPSRPARIAQ